MSLIRLLFFLQIFVVVSSLSQSVCHAKDDYPWSMFLPALVTGQPAPPPPPPVIIADRYQVMGQNGEIIKDIVTNLEWQRCSVGQTWNPDTENCDGTTTGYSWYQATALVFENGWRMPTNVELQSLVYCSTGDPVLIGNYLYDVTCNGEYTRPTIVVEAFPNVPGEENLLPAHYWTSTSNDNDPDMAWVVNFYKGNAGDDGTKFTPGLSIRLVRTPN